MVKRPESQRVSQKVVEFRNGWKKKVTFNFPVTVTETRAKHDGMVRFVVFYDGVFQNVRYYYEMTVVNAGNTHNRRRTLIFYVIFISWLLLLLLLWKKKKNHYSLFSRHGVLTWCGLEMGTRQSPGDTDRDRCSEMQSRPVIFLIFFLFPPPVILLWPKRVRLWRAHTVVFVSIATKLCGTITTLSNK